MDDRQLIADLLSALEYHTEQTRPIEFSKVAIEAAREYLRKPPQRTWVGLTDEEIDKAWRSCDYTVPWEQHRIDIAQAIEAKIKQRNT
jgi:hypothetical protein